MQEYSRRFRRFLERLEQAELDGFLITHPANLAYLFDFSGSTGLACTLHGEATLFIDSRYIEETEGRAKNCRAELCRKPLMDCLKAHLNGRAGTQIGFEADSLTQDQYARLETIGNGPAWHPHLSLVQELRQIKSASELCLMGENFRRAQLALSQSLERFEPECREIDFAGILEQQMRQAGAEGFAFETIVASGARSSLPHGLASEKVIGTEPLLIDFGLRRKGYCTDLTRMRAEQIEVNQVVKIVRDARQAAFEAIRPGVTAGKIDAIARDHIARAGFGECFGHSLGHGLGMEVHELPRIAPASEIPLEMGMLFTLEPGIYRPGQFGVRIEDVVVVEENGARWISNPASP